MPVQIGEISHDFSNPTGLLSDCHRRIEMFLEALESVGRAIAGPPSEETRRVFTAALQYFREAAPKHTADEEESLFPRLRRVRDAAVESALGELDRLEREHRSVENLHAEVERLGQWYLSKGALGPAQATAFGGAVAKLKTIYLEHIGIEDRLVFPVAARSLSTIEQQTIGEEMAARRGLGTTPKLARF